MDLDEPLPELLPAERFYFHYGREEKQFGAEVEKRGGKVLKNPHPSATLILNKASFEKPSSQALKLKIKKAVSASSLKSQASVQEIILS